MYYRHLVLRSGANGQVLRQGAGLHKPPSTRRQFPMTHTTNLRGRWLITVTVLAALVAVFASQAQAAAPVPGIDYTTTPDQLQPPQISVLQNSGGLAPGDVFVAPKKL